MQCRTESAGLVVCKGFAGDEVAFNCPRPKEAVLTPSFSSKYSTVICATVLRGPPTRQYEVVQLARQFIAAPELIAPAALLVGVSLGLLLGRWLVPKRYGSPRRECQAHTPSCR